tara:strand:+ start:455 stop:994 length:540 start_codon:yes stop_codon:yes gene_type:complete
MYYWLEIKNERGQWKPECGYTKLANAKADMCDCIGRYAEWTPRGWLRNKDVRVRACPECTGRIMCGPNGQICLDADATGYPNINQTYQVSLPQSEIAHKLMAMKWDIDILFKCKDGVILQSGLWARANTSIESIAEAWFQHLSESVNIVDGSINHWPEDIAEMKATGKFLEIKITPTTH